MRAVVLREFGVVPSCEHFETPVAATDVEVVEVLAAGLNHLDLGKASGAFYGALPTPPFVLGTDGVGRLRDGRRIYFDESVAPFGAFAEWTLVPTRPFASIPDGLADETAAAIGNAGIAAVTAIESVERLTADAAVLILGATGGVGQIAVQLARLAGAGRVVAAGLDEQRLARLRTLGADETVDLGAASDLSGALSETGPFDLIVDLLWGAPALAAMHAAARGATMVQFGALAGTSIELDATLLRSRQLTLRGISGFAAPIEERIRRYDKVAAYAAAGELVIDVETLGLDDVGEAWVRQRSSGAWKLVLVP